MNYIYETPWWLPTGIALLGIILFITGNNRLEKRLRLAGIIVVALAVILAVVSYFLDSDREKVIKRTNALVQTVERRDWDGMGAYLHPDVTISVFAGREQVVNGTKRAAEYSDLKQARVVSLDATVLPDRIIRVTMRVNGTTRDGSLPTDWTLEWEETDGGWVVRNITPDGGPGIPGGMLEDIIQKRGR
jgi:hypothetical protein